VRGIAGEADVADSIQVELGKLALGDIEELAAAHLGHPDVEETIRSERNATNFPSLEIAASTSEPTSRSAG